MGNVVQCVNYNRARGLNHQQFKAFLDELDSGYSDVVYFSAVRWLSRAATLKRFWNLRQEIKFFIESKHRNVAFLSNENWLNDLAFFTDIIQHLSDLNLKLQGKSQLVNKMFEHICALEKKLELFQVQLSRATLTHFTCLATRKLEFSDLDRTNYGISVQKLRDEFTNRFTDFREYRLDNLRVFSVSQLQAWECFQVFRNGVCFLLHRTRFFSVNNKQYNTISDKMKSNWNCLLNPLIWEWKTVLMISKWNSFNCRLIWKPRGHILKTVW